MPCTYSFLNERIGKIEVLERIDAHGFSLRVHGDGVVRVTVRPGTTQQEVGRFVVEKAKWIEVARMKLAKKNPSVTLFTPETQFSTNEHTLLMTPDSKDRNAHLQVKKGVIHVSYPSIVTPSENEVVQQLVRKGIAFAYKVEGQKILPQRVKELAQRYGFEYATVELKDFKSRWGSCSNKKDIQLNVQLMRLPKHLVDHVILHELCHTIEMNHGPKFHLLLNKVDGGLSAQHSKELKAYRTQSW